MKPSYFEKELARLETFHKHPVELEQDLDLRRLFKTHPREVQRYIRTARKEEKEKA